MRRKKPEIPTEVELVLLSKPQLKEALVSSGVSYETPPDQDANAVWEALHETDINAPFVKLWFGDKP